MASEFDEAPPNASPASTVESVMLDPRPGDWARHAGTTRRSRRRRSLVVTVAAAAILVVLVAATNNVVAAARTISADAAALSRTDESIRAATVARTLAVVAAVTSTRAPAAAVPRDEIADALAVLDDDDDPEAAELVAAIEDLVSRVGTGVDAATVARVENAYRAHLAATTTRRNALAAALQDSSHHLDDISRLAGLALLFVVPALAVGVHQGLTRPDRTMTALAHAADVEDRRRRLRDRDIGHLLARARRGLRDGEPPAVIDQYLAEARALSGEVAVGARHTVDLGRTAAEAVGRLPESATVTVTGPDVTVWIDDGSLRALIAALLRTFTDDARNGPTSTPPTTMRVGHRLDGDGPVATLTILGGGEPPVDALEPDGAAPPGRPSGEARASALAARRLAAALDVDVDRVSCDGHQGWRLTMAADRRASRNGDLVGAGERR